MKLPVIIAVLGAFVAGGFGYWFGRGSGRAGASSLVGAVVDAGKGGEDSEASNRLSNTVDGSEKGTLFLVGELHTASESELLQALRKASNGEVRPSVVGSELQDTILKELVRRGALKQVLTLELSNEAAHDEYLSAAAKAICEEASGELERVLELLETRERKLVADHFLRHLGEHDPQRGLRLLESYPHIQNGGWELFSAWAVKSPEEAIAAARDLKQRTGMDLAYSVIHAWARSDREAAFAFLETLPESERGSLEYAYMSALSGASPEILVQEALAKPQFGGWFLRGSGRMYARRSAEERDGMLDRLPIGVARTEFIRGVAEGLADNPDEAMT